MSSKQQEEISNSEGNFTEAQKAWDTLSAIMKNTPLEVSSEWLEEVSVRWGSQGIHLILQVPQSTDPLWMKKKFLPVANVFYSQLQGGQGRLIVEFEKGPVDEDVRLKAERGAYESIVHPEKLLPVSIYMFQHWLPVLESSSFWVALAMRQTAFVSKATSTRVGKRISLRDLSRWIPMHYSSVRRAILREEFLSWFFTMTKEAYEDLPPEYAVYVEYPLAPHHLTWIEEFLQKGIGKGKRVEDLLKELLDLTREIRQIKHGDLDYPPEYGLERRSVLDLISSYRSGEVDSMIHDLSVQLNREITRDYLTVSIPHYFLLRFGDELSANEAALIWYLRSLYLGEEQELHTFQGYSSLAGKVGFGRKTLQRMFDRCTPLEEQLDQPSFFSPVYLPEYRLGNWLRLEYLSPLEKGQSREYALSLRSNEPIHPEDEKQYYILIDKEIEKINVHSETGVGQKETPFSRVDSQIETDPGQIEPSHGQSATDEGRDETTPAQSAPGDSVKEKHLNILHTKESFNHLSNLPYKELLQPQQLDFLSYQDDSDDQSNKVVVDLHKLLGFDGYTQKQKEKLLPEINKKETYFLAWLMRNHITGANFPVRLAVKNLQENNTTESKYLSLASKGWERIYQLLTDDFELLQEGKDVQKIIKDLQETDFPNVVKDILPEGERQEEKLLHPADRAVEIKDPGEKEIPPLYQHGWNVIKGELQLEMKKGDYDTWVRNIELVEVENEKFVFKTSNTYARDWLKKELEDVLEEKLEPLVKGNGENRVQVKFICR